MRHAITLIRFPASARAYMIMRDVPVTAMGANRVAGSATLRRTAASN